MKKFHEFLVETDAHLYGEAAVDDKTVAKWKKALDNIKKLIQECECPKAKQSLQSYYYSFYSGVRSAMLSSKFSELWPEEYPTWQ